MNTTLQTLEVPIETIIKIVCDHYRIHREAMRDYGRSKTLAFARQMAMTLSRDLTRFSSEEIAAAFDRDDHGTVLHACKRIAQARALDAQINLVWVLLRQRCLDTITPAP